MKTIKVKEHSAEWHKNRNLGLGGSDAAAACGLNKWKSPYDLWLEKTGQVENDVDNERMYWGTVLEDVVAKEFMNRTDKKVHKTNKMYFSEEHPFMLANIDRKVNGENAILECKTTSAYNNKAWQDGEVPENYLIQVMHYLAVTGYERAYIAVLIGGQRFEYTTVERDEELIKMLIEKEQAFWKHVADRTPPDIQTTSSLIDVRYPTAVEDSVQLSNEQLLERFEEIKEQQKMLKDEEAVIKTKLKEELKDAEVGYTSRFVVKWSNYSRKSFDTKRFKQEMPDVYEKYAEEKTGRRMTIKEVE